MAIRECDVDLEAGTVRITKTPVHAPKNTASYRTIPVSRFVLTVIAEALRDPRLPVGDRERQIFLTDGFARPWNRNGYSWAMHKAIKACGIRELDGYMCRWLRACFASAVIAAGAPEAHVQKYVGHTPSTMLLGHYAQISTDSLRTAVVGAFEKWWQKSGSSEILPVAIPIESE